MENSGQSTSIIPKYFGLFRWSGSKSNSSEIILFRKVIEFYKIFETLNNSFPKCGCIEFFTHLDIRWIGEIIANDAYEFAVLSAQTVHWRFAYESPHRTDISLDRNNQEHRLITNCKSQIIEKSFEYKRVYSNFPPERIKMFVLSKSLIEGDPESTLRNW